MLKLDIQSKEIGLNLISILQFSSVSIVNRHMMLISMVTIVS
jgi:hypothetical protein